MKLSTAIFTSVLAIGLVTGFTALPTSTADAGSHKVKGKIEKIKREGRQVYINGTKYFISGSRTNVCIKGACDGDRANLKVGMKCKARTNPAKKGGKELKKIKCK